jgi:hypothetical protein
MKNLKNGQQKQGYVRKRKGYNITSKIAKFKYRKELFKL